MRGVFAGILTLDIVQHGDDSLLVDSKLKSRESEFCCGGPAANAAVAFAALGGESHLFTVLGTHPVSHFLADDLARHGVLLHDISPDCLETPQFAACYIHTPTGHRSVVASRPPAPENIDLTEVASCISGSAVVMIDGHHPDLAIEIVKSAQCEGVPIVVDAGSWKEIYGILFPHSTVVICSEPFAFPGDEPSATLDHLMKTGVPFGAVTAGPGEIKYLSKDGETGSITPPQIHCVDSLGAGDIFHGAYCYFLVRDNDRVLALQSAADVAAFSCRTTGTRQWISEYSP